MNKPCVPDEWSWSWVALQPDAYACFVRPPRRPGDRLIICILGWLIVLVALAIPAYAQDTAYETQANILYYSSDTLTDYAQQQCRLDVYYPLDSTGFATVVWFHGGGLTGGARYVPEELQAQGMAVVAVSYRLAPRVGHPTYIEDAAAAVAWTFAQIEEYGGDPDRIFVSGHSAGGYLASMVGLDQRWLAAHALDANRIAGLIPYSGHAITHFRIREERGIPGTQPIVDEYAPLYHVRPDAPPYVIVTGDRKLELLGRYEENAYMMRMMRIVGHQRTFLYEIDGHDHSAMQTPAHHILLQHVRDHVAQK